MLKSTSAQLPSSPAALRDTRVYLGIITDEVGDSSSMLLTSWTQDNLSAFPPLSGQAEVTAQGEGLKHGTPLGHSARRTADSRASCRTRCNDKPARVIRVMQRSSGWLMNVYCNAGYHLEIKQTGVATQTQHAAYGRDGKTHLESNPSRRH